MLILPIAVAVGVAHAGGVKIGIQILFLCVALAFDSLAQFNSTNTGVVVHDSVETSKLLHIPQGEIANVQADGAEAQNEAGNAIDADPKTIWHTPWQKPATAFPHWLEVEFKSARRVVGFTALPRQDSTRNGWICDYAIYASNDGKQWGQALKRGTFAATKELKTVSFDAPVTGRFFMFVALSGFGGQYASLAELSFLEEIKTVTNEAKSSRQAVSRITVDGLSGGKVFDGVGAVSSGGSSRLLLDYPERQRGEILDYLFKPNYGAALQILKIEIGADADATCGAEPSHQRAPEAVQCNLGYEWWLAKEAKARNPDIKLYGLAWGAPGWVKKFWSDDNIRYTLAWLDCAKQNGLRIDYIGGGNERGYDADYYIKLRHALNERGYSHVKLVATDDHHPPDYWAVASEMKTNRAFADAVDILGQHDICVWRTEQRHCYVSEDAAALGKPLWDSENSTQDCESGYEALARAMNRHYIEGRITGNLNWALIDAYYGTFPAPGTVCCW